MLRELPVSGSQAPAEPAAPPPPPAAALPQPQPQPVAAERVVPPVWYTVAVCTGGEEGAGLAPPTSAVFLVLHGTRGSSQRVKLPSQAGDFERGQEDVFRWAALGKRSVTRGPRERLPLGNSSACMSG